MDTSALGDPRVYYRGYWLVEEGETIAIYDSHEKIDGALTVGQAKRVIDQWHDAR